MSPVVLGGGPSRRPFVVIINYCLNVSNELRFYVLQSQAAGMTKKFQANSTAMREYKYTELLHPRSIRLLSLQPNPSRTETLPIRITLREASLDDHPPYECVSYTWALENGDRARSSPIECNDDGSIMVTANCEAALLRFRDVDSARTLWVDTICINQDETAERSRQITLMRDIYSSASKVLVWLGKASVERDPATQRPYSDFGIDYLHRLGAEALERVPEGSYAEERFTGPVYATLRELRALEFDDAMAQSTDFRGLMTILSYSFWKRVWVIQELALAPTITVFCGHAVVEGAGLEALAVTLILDSGQEYRPEVLQLMTLFSVRVLNQRRATRLLQVERSTLLAFLRMTRGSAASDARDQIFGMLALVEEDGDVRNPVPDYGKDVIEVYTELALGLMASTGSTEVLLSANKPSKIPALPSWAPDWTLPTQSFRSASLCNAVKDSKFIYRVSVDNTKLEIKGCQWDVVEQITATAHYEGDDQRTFSYFRHIIKWQKWCKLALSLPSYPTGETAKEALLPTLCDDEGQRPESGGHAGEARRLPGEHRAQFEAWYHILTSPGADLKEIRHRMINNHDGALKNFYYLLFNAQKEQEFCVTRKGYMALVPEQARVGDCVVLLYGRAVAVCVKAGWWWGLLHGCGTVLFPWHYGWAGFPGRRDGVRMDCSTMRV